MAGYQQAVFKVMRNLRNSRPLLQNEYQGKKILLNIRTKHIQAEVRSGQLRGFLSKYRRGLCITSGSVIGFSIAYSWVSKHKDVFAAELQLEGNAPVSVKKEKPEHKLSRVVSKTLASNGK